jgi:hypothetical protein
MSRMNPAEELVLLQKRAEMLQEEANAAKSAARLLEMQQEFESLAGRKAPVRHASAWLLVLGLVTAGGWAVANDRLPQSFQPSGRATVFEDDRLPQSFQPRARAR